MGKALKASLLPKSYVKSRISFKKKQEPNPSEKLVNYYFKTLSINFGADSIVNVKNDNKKIKKRKRKCSTSFETEKDSFKSAKRTKLKEEPHSPNELNACSNTVQNNQTCRFKYLSTSLNCSGKTDLFCLDELRSKNEYMHHIDWFSIICDEISLEGLDGITIEALWKRLKNVFQLPVLLEGKEDILWNFICSLYEVEYLLLDNPRGELIIHDRNAFLCNDTGLVSEPVTPFPDIYPYKMISANNIRGSCHNYGTRLEISEEVRQSSLENVLSDYGLRLVIVASQSMRQQALFYELCDPLVELSDNEYGLLERVGRSRKMGELTQGKLSIQQIIKDSKSIFHLRKTLEKKLLLKNQFFVLRDIVVMQNKTGKLLHLSRFYNQFKSKPTLLIENIVEFLRSKQSHIAEFSDFRKNFPHNSIAKLLKYPDFLKYVKTDIYVPFRERYPNASESDWKCKNRPTEKKLRLIKLIDPTINVQAFYNSNDQNSDDECLDDEAPGSKIINFDFLKEIYLHIFSKGKEGITLQDLEKIIELDFYTIRSGIRNLVSKNVIDTVRYEIGRQKHIKYYARCFHDEDVSQNVFKYFLNHDVQKTENYKSDILSQKNDSQLISIKHKMLRGCNSLNEINGKSFIKISGLLPDNIWDNEKEIIDDYTFFVPRTLRFPLFHYPNVETKICDIPIKKLNKAVKCSHEIIIDSSYDDINTKTLLLKSLIFKIDTSISLSEQHYNIDYNTVINEPTNVSNRAMNTYSKDFLLGNNPEIILEEEDLNNCNMFITTTIISSKPSQDYVYDYKTYCNRDRSITATALGRINLLLELVNQYVVINDIHKLLKDICSVEADNQSSMQGKMDKNTLHRLLVKLSNEGYLKIYKLVHIFQNKIKVQWFVLHPTADLHHPTIKSTIEQIKLKCFFSLSNKDENKVMYNKISESNSNQILETNLNSNISSTQESLFESDDVQTSVQEWRFLCSVRSSKKFRYNRFYGKKIGYQPKFVRLQLLHEFLFYLVYEHHNSQPLTLNDLPEVGLHFIEEELNDIPPMFSNEINWKLFVPPLPEHTGWSSGWCLMCDILFRLPLSLFLAIFNIKWEISDLNAYKDHPIKKHYLVKYLPYDIRSIFFSKRKYIVDVCDSVNKLCMMGLVQLGPQKLWTKEKLFMYVNRKALLLETSSSSPSYHQITPKEYPKLIFHFNSLMDVKDYWSRLWTISMMTPLGQRWVMRGKYLTTEKSNIKPDLIAALQSKTPMQAIMDDIGYIPGDKLGACGLDSSLWVHFKKNWMWNTSSKQPSDPNKNSSESNKKRIAPLKYKELLNRKTKKINQLESEHQKLSNKEQSKTNALLKKKETKVRKLTFVTKQRTPRQYRDAKDRIIWKKHGKRYRPVWTEDEDKILIVCKISSIFLFKQRKQIIPYYVIRDILHSLNPSSSNKTTSNCIRRIGLLLKTALLKEIELKTGSLMNILIISKFYSSILYLLQNSPDAVKFEYYDLVTIFIYLVSFLHHNYNYVEDLLRDSSHINDYFAPASKQFFNHLLNDNDRAIFKNPENVVEIQIETIKSVIISALNGDKRNQEWSYHLFNIYRQYSDNLLRNAVYQLKNSRLISLKKSWKKKINMDFPSPFQLSNMYIYMQSSTFSGLTFHSMYQNYLELIGENFKYLATDNMNIRFKYAKLLAYNEISSLWKEINFIFDLPSSAYVLNPYIEDHNMLKQELAIRFQHILKQRLQEQNKPKSLPKVNDSPKTFKDDKEDAQQMLKYIRRVQNNIKLSLIKTPCFCNEVINENFSKLMSCESLNQLDNYMEIIIAELICICVKLFNSNKSSMKVAKTVTKKIKHRIKPTFEGPSKKMLVQLRYLAYIVREYFKLCPKTDVCLVQHTEDSPNSTLKDFFLENVLQRVLAEDNTVEISNPANPKATISKTDKKGEVFTKWQKILPYKEDDVLSNTELLNKIPNIEEIEREMMVSKSSEDRSIPYINDLAPLLFKNQIPEMSIDEKNLEKYKSHFIAQYPIFERLDISNMDEFKENALKNLFDHFKRNDFRQKVDRFHKRIDPLENEVNTKIMEFGGDMMDFTLTQDIIKFIYDRSEIGVGGPELREKFQHQEVNLSLVTIIKILVEMHVLLRVGISEIVFVHHKFQSDWLINTFALSSYEQMSLNVKLTNSEDKVKTCKIKEEIDKSISTSNHINVLLMPWIKVDGSVNLTILKKWLTQVLSYCLENPKIQLLGLCKKFNLIKPVEIFYILEILEEFNCLQLFVELKTEISLLSDEIVVNTSQGTFLDPFKDIYVEVFNYAGITMGFALNKEDEIEFIL